MGKPKLLGIRYARLAQPVKDTWEVEAKGADPDVKKAALAKLKSLKTLEARITTNVLTAGDTVQHNHWPACLAKDYGAVPNLFRFELADRWRGLYALIGEPGGVRAVILYLWDHATYDKMHGYAKK
ncbi:MAG: hypothetical protein AABY18_01960 [Candidatus Thermoplasmatota archaeon]